ncbi:MAG: CHAT domain-containing tetratricopeptide repeat protein [Bacteroidales bacterium]
MKAISQNQTNDTSQAFYYCIKANDFSLNRNFDSAAFNYNKAAQIYKEAKVWDRYVQTMNIMSEQYWKVGRYDEANEIVKPVLKIAEEKFGPKALETAMCYDNLGDIAGIRQQLDESVAYYEKELAIIKNIYGENHPKVASVYKCIGLSYYYAGDYYKSIEILKHAESNLKNGIISDGILLAKIYTNIGSAYRFLTLYPESSDYYQKAIILYLENGYTDYFLIAFIYQALGNNFAEMQKTEMAIVFYHQALDLMDKHVEGNSLAMASIYERVGNSYTSLNDELGIQEFNGKNPVVTGLNFDNKAFQIRKAALPEDHPTIGTSLVNCGVSYLYLKEYDSAFLYLRRAEKIFDKHGDVYADKLAVCYNNLAGVYNRFQQYDSAEYYFRKSLNLHLRVNGKYFSSTVMAYNQLSQALFNQGKYDSALFYNQKSLQANIKSFDEDNPYINPAIDTSISYLFLKGSLALKTNILIKIYETRSYDILDLQAALQTLEVAVEAANIEINKQSFESGKLYYSKVAYDVHSKAISLCLKLNEITSESSYLDRAFVHSEQNRAFIMKEAILNSYALNQATESNKGNTGVQKMKSQLTIIEKKLTDEFNKNGLDYIDHINELQSKLISSTVQLDSASGIVNPEKSNDEDKNLKFPVYDFTSVKEVSKVLPDENSTLIEYFMGDSTLYVFMITNKDFIVKAIHFDSTLFELIGDFKKSIEDRDFISNQPEQAFELYGNSSYQLYQILFPQIVQSAMGNETRLYIVPDGILNYISFDALLVEKPDSGSFGYSALSYLINKYPITYSYSASFLNVHFEHHNTNAFYGGFAPLYATNELASAPELESFAEFRGNPALLKENRNEVKAVANLLNGDVFLNEMAGEGAFKNTAEKYNILHFAMHALVNNADPLYSKLIFSQTNNTLEDDYLNAYEIYGLNLNSSLAVLSACNTGFGIIKEGEGPMSLSRAFMYAGVPSVVSTFWPAHDKASKDIMIDFFSGIKNKLPLDEALRNSKLNYLKNADPQFAHPYFWANFMLIGDNNPVLEIKQWYQSQWIYLGVIGCILLISLIWFVKKGLFNPSGYLLIL